MQNKPNVKDAKMNVSSFMTIKYEKLDTWLSGKNKPNSNPIYSQSHLSCSTIRVLTKTCFFIKNTNFYMRNSQYISKSLQSNNLHQLLTFRIFCIKPILPILTKVLSNHSPIFTLLNKNITHLNYWWL